jgi:hypothetical protein
MSAEVRRPRQMMCMSSSTPQGTHCASRVHRPDADLQRTAPAVGPRRVRRLLQPAQTPPVPPATTTRSGRPGYCRAGLASSAEEGAQRCDQRVPPASVADPMKSQFRYRATGFEALQALAWRFLVGSCRSDRPVLYARRTGRALQASVGRGAPVSDLVSSAWAGNRSSFGDTGSSPGAAKR